MKKTYEPPVLTTGLFDVEDVITVSSHADDRLGASGSGWEIPISSYVQFH